MAFGLASERLEKDVMGIQSSNARVTKTMKFATSLPRDS